MTTTSGWHIERARGSAAAFHARPLPDPARRVVWVHEVDRPAVVLGSAQPASVVDEVAADRAGVEVVRRRSGGGAVWVAPGHVLWVDLIVARGDPLWDDDVGRASWWVGELWVEALTAIGVEGATAHRGAMVRTPWSSLVCFAGVGPGEVTVGPGGPKVVGISQRRTREAARFQCAAYQVFDPVPMLALLTPPTPRDAEVAPLAVGVGDQLVALTDAVLAALPA